jgi:RNA polymerase sigma-70 factor (ECF subfamily)
VDVRGFRRRAPEERGVGTAALPESFDAFFEREHGGLFGALYLVTRDRHAAEDLMQEAFLKLWERWDRVAGLEDPTGYLYRTAMNAFRMRYRRAAVAARRLVQAVVPRARDPLDEVEERDEVDRVLLQLTPRQRAALVMTELLGYSTEAAGEILGVKPVTVRVLVSQARKALREVSP